MGRRIRKALLRLGFILDNTKVQIGLFLNIYQPSTQSKETFKVVYDECYAPLLKFLKSIKEFKVTLNVPLSLLELMDNYGYKSWLDGIRELVESQKVEIVGSGAYHPILPLIEEEFANQQIILNEYGLGYYFGKKTGFEGEKSILVKDLDGFFPPEMAVDSKTSGILSELGYKWVIVDESSLATVNNKGNIHQNVFTVNGDSLKYIVRDRTLSNILSFKRSINIDDLTSYIRTHTENKSDFFVIALDGEFFGHHYKQGLYVLDFIVQEVLKLGGTFETLSNIVSDANVTNIDSISDSSWGASDEDISNGNLYPLWKDGKNPIHKLQWKYLEKFQDEFKSFFSQKELMADYENLPIWHASTLNTLPKPEIAKNVEINLLVNKVLQSDQFWWASKRELPNNILLYNPDLVKSTFGLLDEICRLHNNEEFTASTQKYQSDLIALLA